MNIFSALQKIAVLTYQNSEEMSDLSKSETNLELQAFYMLEGSYLHLRAV